MVIVLAVVVAAWMYQWLCPRLCLYNLRHCWLFGWIQQWPYQHNTGCGLSWESNDWTHVYIHTDVRTYIHTHAHIHTHIHTWIRIHLGQCHLAGFERIPVCSRFELNGFNQTRARMYVLMYDYIYVLFVCRNLLYIHRRKRTGTGD